MAPEQTKKQNFLLNQSTEKNMNFNLKKGFGAALAQVMMIIAVVAMFCAMAVPRAKAEGGTQSFQATNILNSAVNLTAYPSNGVGTNTGVAVNVANYDRAGFYFAGYVTTASTATVTLVRSPYSFSPSYTTLSNNFESVSQKTFTIPMPTTGPFLWTTNLEPDFLRPANWIGINLLTNSVGTITNLDVGVSKKLIPTGSK